MVGGIVRSRSARIEKIDSTAPAAPTDGRSSIWSLTILGLQHRQGDLTACVSGFVAGRRRRAVRVGVAILSRAQSASRSVDHRQRSACHIPFPAATSYGSIAAHTSDDFSIDFSHHALLHVRAQTEAPTYRHRLAPVQNIAFFILWTTTACGFIVAG